ncbi:Alpha/beta-Hydrolases superfamily protein isoform 2 [Hibiscus syriacus]|uniref:Alpha/beta-Hydrolases superfamily protein isoform 2 n=1 Tax=Hibiscus syriacus TaxID=106335 RepID=A0A6A2ZQA5_HIBSY|nr:Alpha/beta-Hydrolases superfamily protein isoform 2 [Hibiscus syriacus]
MATLKERQGTTNEVSHRRIKTNGIWLHIAEQGTGPLVLLLHGFPEIWYSWRHQITFLANHGYHVVAPDLRGYGDSDSPPSPTSYTNMHLVGDIIGLLDHFGELQAFVVGHDWGAVIGWHLSLFRPERVKGLINISVPYYGRNPDAKLAEFLISTFGDGFYISQFQEPGRAERAFARYDCLTVIKKFLLITHTDNLIAPPGMEIIDYLEIPSPLPPWITEMNCRFLLTSFGNLASSELLITTVLWTCENDIGFEINGTRQYVQGSEFRSLVPNLEVVILDGHHFLQEEKHHQVSEEILSFLRKFPAE